MYSIIKNLKDEDKEKLFGRPFTSSSNIAREESKISLQHDESKIRSNIFKIYDGVRNQQLRINRYLISFNSRWMEVLDFFVLSINFFTCFIVLYHASIKKGEKLDNLHYIFEGIFLLSIILRFFHQYQNPETLEIVSEFRPIAYNYIFKGWFFVDIISIIPYELILTQDASLIKMLRIIRITRLIEIIDNSLFDKVILSFLSKYKNEKVTLVNKIKFLYRIIRLILIAITITYFIGCLWYLFCYKVAKHYPKNNFIKYYELDNRTELESLIISCYFTLTTLTTVGYGDYVAINNAERIFAIFIMLLGVAMFSYVMGNLNELISSYDKQIGISDKATDLQNWLILLAKFSHKPFSSDLLKRIDKHFVYFWENDRNFSILKNDPYMNSLPKSIKLNVIDFLWGDILNKYSHFFLYYPGNREAYFKFYYNISFCLLPRMFCPKEFIYLENEEVEEMYFLLDGNIELGYNSNENNIKYGKFSKIVDYIGDFYCLFHVKSKYFYRAKREVHTFALKKYDISKYCAIYPDFHNKLKSKSFRKYTDNVKIPMENLKQKDNIENIEHDTSNKLLEHKVSGKENELNIKYREIEKKFVKLEDDFANVAQYFHQTRLKIEKEMAGLNSHIFDKVIERK